SPSGRISRSHGPTSPDVTSTTRTRVPPASSTSGSPGSGRVTSGGPGCAVATVESTSDANVDIDHDDLFIAIRLLLHSLVGERLPRAEPILLYAVRNHCTSGLPNGARAPRAKSPDLPIQRCPSRHRDTAIYSQETRIRKGCAIARTSPLRLRACRRCALALAARDLAAEDAPLLDHVPDTVGRVTAALRYSLGSATGCPVTGWS